MKLSIERIPESQIVLDITAEDEEYGRALDKATRAVIREVQVPGFRKGKAPRHMVERLFGRAVFVEEANRHLMDDLYKQAIKQVQDSEEFIPVGEPAVEIVAPEPLQFTVTIPVYPAIEVGDYQSVRVEPKDATVEENEVDEVVVRFQKSQSPWEDPDEARVPREGDQVTIDLTVEEAGNEFQTPLSDAVFVLGESNLMEAIRERIEGMRVGESLSFELTFGEEDEVVDPRLRGKNLTYALSLKDLKERRLLALDDEFAKTVSDNETLAALRNEIREDLHQGKTAELRTATINEIVDAMAEGATIEMPAIMVNEAVDREVAQIKARLAQQRLNFETYLRLNNQTESAFREEQRPNATRRVRNSLLLSQIAEKEGISVDDEAIDKEIEDLIAAGGSEQLVELYRGDYFRRVLRDDLYEKAVTDRLIEIATDGRGAVLNAWTPPPTPEPEPEQAEGADVESALTVEGREIADDSRAASISDLAGGEPESTFTEMPEPDQMTSGEDVQDFVEVEGVEDCPEGYPVKGNASSMIYHTPESASYGATEPEICFTTEEAAERRGFRAPRQRGEAAGAGVTSIDR